MRSLISALAIPIFTLEMFSCTTSTKTFEVHQLDTIRATFVPISELADKYHQYQGQYIETTGTFYAAFETFAIFTDKNMLTGERKGFWLETDEELHIQESLFGKMNGNLITVKGILDTNDKGHLGAYPGTIKKIYFWQLSQ